MEDSPVFLVITHSPYVIRGLAENRIWKCLDDGNIRFLNTENYSRDEKERIKRAGRNSEVMNGLLFA